MSYQLNLKGSDTLAHDDNKGAIYYDGTYLWSGADSGAASTHIFSCTFNGTTFGNQITYDFNPTNAVYTYCIGGDGTYTYFVVYDQQTNYFVYAVSRTGDTITVHGLYDTGVGSSSGTRYPTTIICDSQGYIYISFVRSSGSNLIVLSFDGTNFTLREDIVSGGVSISKLCHDGTNLYIADTSTIVGLTKRTFDGSNFTTLVSYDWDSLSGLGHDGTYLYAYSSVTDRLYAINPTTLEIVGNYYGFSNNDVQNIYCDGYFIYLLREGADVVALTFNGTDFTLVSTYTDTGILNTTSYRNRMHLYPPYVFYCGGTGSNYVIALKMDLTAQFTVDKLTGLAPSTHVFTVV